MNIVKENSTVSVHYTGKFEDGTIFDSSIGEGKDPLTTTLGMGTLIKGFEKSILGMKVGDKKTVEISCDDAYGQINPDLIGEVQKDKIPSEVQVGHMLQTMTDQGPMNVRVMEIKENSAILDANHPLSGKNLIFDLELISVE